MAAPSPLAEHCLELLSPLGAVRTRRMFGGWGFYLDDLFFALIAYERLFLKVNNATRPRFEAAGCEPFIYSAKNNKQVSLGYWSAPADAMDSPALMEPWARLALQAALAARSLKAPASQKRAASSGAKPKPTKASRRA